MNAIPDFYTGAPLEPSDLWYRDDFISDLWETLETQHGLLTAPRRTGKTSVMDYLAANPKNGFSPVPVFVQDLDHPGDFIMTLLDAFHDKHPDLFRSMFSKSSRIIKAALQSIGEIETCGFKVALKEQDPDWKNNWKIQGDELFEHVRKSGHKVLFIVDEFPDMILNMNKYHPQLVLTFLGWFRGHRQKPLPRQDPVRWLLGGSVNLSTTLDSLGCLDKINDLRDERLPVLTPPQIENFVQRMLTERGVALEPDFSHRFAERLGQPIPLFMQMLAQDLNRLWKRRTEPQQPLCKKDLDSAFEELIVSSASRDKLQHYYSRIAQYYNELKRSAAYEILAKLSISPAGLEKKRIAEMFDLVMDERGEKLSKHDRQNLFNQLLRDLENDFYVAETSDGLIDFASGLLKAWWRKYYA
ncbi:MAG: hypothetical protein ACYC4Q_08720 [Victivallaceae bacterium]